VSVTKRSCKPMVLAKFEIMSHCKGEASHWIFIQVLFSVWLWKMSANNFGIYQVQILMHIWQNWFESMRKGGRQILFWSFILSFSKINLNWLWKVHAIL
jgi:hypothetical protein